MDPDYHCKYQRISRFQDVNVLKVNEYDYLVSYKLAQNDLLLSASLQNQVEQQRGGDQQLARHLCQHPSRQARHT